MADLDGGQPGGSEGQTKDSRVSGWAAVTLPSRRRRPHRSRQIRNLALTLVVLVVLGAGARTLYQELSGASIAVARPVASQQLQALAGTKINAAALAAKVEPAVVDITVQLAGGVGSAAGTGMILTSSGEVVTNNHVVDGASLIEVKIRGHRHLYPARVLGVDPIKDVALLQLEGIANLPTVVLSGSTPFVGEPVVAIGNALDLTGPPTVTEGTITALHRAIMATDEYGGNPEHLTGMLQTDAALAPGDSGGPLVNALGQVVGMNTAAYAGTPTPSFSDVGFAIPIANVLSVVRQIQAGRPAPGLLIGPRPMMGVMVSAASAPPPGLHPALDWGALVVEVVPGTPAAQAGLHVGDVIVAFDGRTVHTVTQLSDLEQRLKPGDWATVTWVTTSGQRHVARVRLVVGPAV